MDGTAFSEISDMGLNLVRIVRRITMLRYFSECEELKTQKKSGGQGPFKPKQLDFKTKHFNNGQKIR